MRHHPFSFSTQTMHWKRHDEIPGIESLQEILSRLLIQMLKARNRLEDKGHVNRMSRTRLEYVAHLGMSLYTCQREPLLQEVHHVLIDIVGVVCHRFC